MPEPENPKPPTTPEESTAKQPPQANFCHIHDEFHFLDSRNEIRENVCVSVEEAEKYGLKEHLTEFEGKHYCLLHLPTKEKDSAKFEEIFQARLEKTDRQCTAIEAEFPDDEAKQKEAKRERNINYDFRYVWFPSEVNLINRKFSASADFNEATFSASAYFSSATFSADASFISAIFSAEADFMSAIFSAEADFMSAIFSASASFRSATFSADAYFSSATFNTDANFRSATFKKQTYFETTLFCEVVKFSQVTFEERSHVKFWNTLICSKVSFVAAEVSGYFEFEGDVFLSSEKVKELREKKGLSIGEEQEAILEFQDVRLKNPERLSFSSIKLRPNWFVNVLETRKIEFSDVEWLNSEIDIDRTGLDRELECLRKRNVSRAEKSLIKACNQLADNAEANRRFEEAERFRKQSIALEKKKCHIHDAVDESDKPEIRKAVCQDFPVVNEVGGNYYCLWHNPDKNKAVIFKREFEKRRKADHTDFCYVVFPIKVFYGVEDAPRIKVLGATYQREKLPDNLNFTGATFFRRVEFQKAAIKNLNFTESHFTEDAELVFEHSSCTGKITFDKAIFDGKLFITGNHDRRFFNKCLDALSLKRMRFANPQSINFDTLRLRPHYFIGVDASKFVFQNCKWWDENEKVLDIEEEIKLSSHNGLAETCNKLAINYEESRNFDESTNFRFTAMEAKRLAYEGWRKTVNLYWLYKLSSGYGERWGKAMIILLGIIFLCGVFYNSPFAYFEVSEKIKAQESATAQTEEAKPTEYHKMKNFEGFIHSLNVAALQRPEPKPAPDSDLTKAVVILETIFAPLQAALLALAIRRKFMR